MNKIFFLRPDAQSITATSYKELLEDAGFYVYDMYLLSFQPVWEEMDDVGAIVVMVPANGSNDKVYEEMALHYSAHNNIPVIILGEKEYLDKIAPVPSFFHVLSTKSSPNTNSHRIEKIVINGTSVFLAGANTVTEQVKEAQTPDLPSPKTNVLHKKWLLKVNDQTWSFDDLRVGADCYFNTTHHLGKATTDYELFHEVRENDILVLYAYDYTNAVVAFARVTRAVHLDQKLGEIILFWITELINPAVKLASFQHSIDYGGGLTAATDEKLFPLSEEAFERILNVQLDVSQSPRYNQHTITTLVADTSSGNSFDALDFAEDVQALAAVIAYKELQPPLAIGLFGNWGSGKSFFMQKLEREIDRLSGSDSGVYCRNIIPIHFNSWHYSDANLWASLVTRMFSELKARGCHKASKEAATIFEQLHSAKELRALTQQEKDKVDKDIENLKKEKTDVEADIKDKADKLVNISVRDVVKLVMEDAEVQKQIEVVKNEYAFLHLESYEDVKHNVEELGAAGNNIVKAIKMIYATRKGNLGLIWLWALVVGLGIYILIANVQVLERQLGDLKHLLLFAGIITTQWMQVIKPGLRTINNVCQRVYSLKNTIEKKQADEHEKKSKELEAVNTELQKAGDKQLALEKEIAALKEKSTQLELEIKDIASGKKLQLFIESKVADARYDGGLGIISWIRKDFEELSRLLVQQNTVAKQAADFGEQVDAHFLVDRIVLYIDDLDRCEKSTVVKVLESINLLLAFPLFVVVVGVDPRWMYQSLNKQYAGLLQDGTDVSGGSATSKDYLEKIFQIPFRLKPMGVKGRQQLIRAQFDSQMPQSPAVDSKITTTLPDQTVAGKESRVSEEPGKNILPAEPITPVYSQTATSKEKLLQISQKEIDFMCEISFLIGDSPRTVKRFVNIYRVIRSHAQFQFVDDKELEHYFAAMLLLADKIGTSYNQGILSQRLYLNHPGGIFSDLFYDAERLPPAEDAPDGIPVARIVSANSIGLEKFTINQELINRFTF